MGFTAKGEKRLELQDIAQCKIAHVATDQEIAKKKNPEPTEGKEQAASEDAGLPSSTPANPGFAGRPQRKRKKPARLLDYEEHYDP